MSDEDESETSLLDRLMSASVNQPQQDKVYLDESNELHWPVYFLYPEFNQSDFIEDFNGNNR